MNNTYDFENDFENNDEYIKKIEKITRMLNAFYDFLFYFIIPRLNQGPDYLFQNFEIFSSLEIDILYPEIICKGLERSEEETKIEFYKNISYLYSLLSTVFKIVSKHPNQKSDIYIKLSEIAPKWGFVINADEVNISEKCIELMALFELSEESKK